jgi:hypothetical protein
MDYLGMTTRVPLLVPVFNNPYYVERFFQHINKFDCFEILLFDNDSTYPPLLSLYEKLPDNIRVVRLGYNFGPRIFWHDETVYNSLPDIFCISDPDVEFNEQIPPNFINLLIDLTYRREIGKVGFALDISMPHLMTDAKFRHADGWKDILESESEHWQHEIEGDPIGEKIYLSDIDTTFALYNKKFFNPIKPFEGIRVAGSFTARHLPWYKDVKIPSSEREFYSNTAQYSYYSSKNIPVQLRELFSWQDKNIILDTAIYY